MKPKRRIDLVFLIAYLFVDGVPLWGAVDIIGPQWLYIGLLNLGVLNYLWDDSRQERQLALENGIRSPASLFYCIYCVLAAVSIFFAMNIVESIVTYARTIITLTAFFNVLLLLRRSMDIFPMLSQVVALLLLGQCIAALAGFFSDLPTTGFAHGIVNMKAGMGNKNVFAASIVIKLPFVLFNIYNANFRWKIVNAAIILVSLYTLFLLNARASFMGLLIQLLMLLMYEIGQVVRNKKTRSFISRTAFFFIPFLIALLLSNITIKRIRGDEKTFYGTVSERIKSINFLTEYGTGSRKHIFRSTLDIIRRHPVTGVGYGNWKLASIPYETYYNKDAVVNYHSHNDFLETTAETGIIGGLSYLAIFITIAVLYVRRSFKNDRPVSYPFLFASLALGGYFADAFLNFPLERTTMQVYFAFWLAVVANESGFLLSPGGSVKKYKFFIAAAILINACTAYISYQCFLSMRMQAHTGGYLHERIAEGIKPGIIPEFPPIPDLTQTALPVKAVSAEYLLFYNRHQEALQLLNKAAAANPYLGYTEYLKGMLYLQTRQTDSAFYYASKAFDLKPLNFSHYRLLMEVCSQKKDSATMSEAYLRFKQYRSDPMGLSVYQEAMGKLNGSK